MSGTASSDPSQKSYWLLKTEPEEYSWTDLTRETNAVWDGVRAPRAIKNIKVMKPGDLAFIYHTGPERAIIGIAQVTSLPMQNPMTSEWTFTLKALEKLAYPISLKAIKASGLFADWDLVRLPRLSVVPVSAEQWKQVMNWSGENTRDHEQAQTD